MILLGLSFACWLHVSLFADHGRWIGLMEVVVAQYMRM